MTARGNNKDFKQRRAEDKIFLRIEGCRPFHIEGLTMANARCWVMVVLARGTIGDQVDQQTEEGGEDTAERCSCIKSQRYNYIISLQEPVQFESTRMYIYIYIEGRP